MDSLGAILSRDQNANNEHRQFKKTGQTNLNYLLISGLLTGSLERPLVGRHFVARSKCKQRAQTVQKNRP